MNTQPTIEELWTLLQEQQGEIAQLKEQLAMRQREEAAAAPNETGTTPATIERRLSRAGLLKAAASGVVGVAGVGVLLRRDTGIALADSGQFGSTVRPEISIAVDLIEAHYGKFLNPPQGVPAITAQGHSNFGVDAYSDATYAVRGTSKTDVGVFGSGKHGVEGSGSISGVGGTGQIVGVGGSSFDGIGVQGKSVSGTGMWAESGGVGVRGISSGSALTGVYGVNTANNGTGVAGVSFADGSQHALGAGVGVVGESGSGTGVRGISATGIGVSATSGEANHTASYGYNTGNGWGVIGRSYANATANRLGTGIGVEGNSGSGTGVKGTSVASGVGVAGVVSSDPRALGGGIGVSGTSDRGAGVKGASGLGNGVVGITTTTGTGILGNPITDDSLAGVYGVAESPNGHGYGVIGRSWNSKVGSLGDGIGVMGESGLGIGVLGNSTAGSGLTGTSSSGRGGIFAGGAAQIQLAPSTTAATHPATGQAGDLFVDTNKRLWYCQGGTQWKQLA